MNTHITRCTPGTDTKNTTGCVRGRMDRSGREAEIRRAAGEMLEKKFLLCIGRKMQGTEYREKKSVKWKNWKMQGKQFDSGDDDTV